MNDSIKPQNSSSIHAMNNVAGKFNPAFGQNKNLVAA